MMRATLQRVLLLIAAISVLTSTGTGVNAGKRNRCCRNGNSSSNQSCCSACTFGTDVACAQFEIAAFDDYVMYYAEWHNAECGSASPDCVLQDYICWDRPNPPIDNGDLPRTCQMDASQGACVAQCDAYTPARVNWYQRRWNGSGYELIADSQMRKHHGGVKTSSKKDKGYDPTYKNGSSRLARYWISFTSQKDMVTTIYARIYLIETEHKHSVGGGKVLPLRVFGTGVEIDDSTMNSTEKGRVIAISDKNVKWDQKSSYLVTFGSTEYLVNTTE